MYEDSVIIFFPCLFLGNLLIMCIRIRNKGTLLNEDDEPMRLGNGSLYGTMKLIVKKYILIYRIFNNVRSKCLHIKNAKNKNKNLYFTSITLMLFMIIQITNVCREKSVILNHIYRINILLILLYNQTTAVTSMNIKSPGLTGVVKVSLIFRLSNCAQTAI